MSNIPNKNDKSSSGSDNNISCAKFGKDEVFISVSDI